MKELYEVFHTSYLNEGQYKTYKDVMVLGHMAKLGLSCVKTKIV